MRATARALVVFLSLLGAGCRETGRPALMPVSGVVTYRGEPVEGVHVTFFLEDAPRCAMGTSQSDGRYYLTSFTDGDGAVPGRHEVTLFKPDPRAGALPSAKRPIGRQPIRTAADALELLQSLHKSLLPQRYASRGTSGLMRTVETDGRNHFDFDLTE